MFWVLWIFNAVMALIPIYFFIEGLGDGTVSSDNIGIWIILLLVVVVILGGSYWLKTTNHLTAAKVILWVATIPAVLAIIFFLTIMLSDTRWN